MHLTPLSRNILQSGIHAVHSTEQANVHNGKVGELCFRESHRILAAVGDSCNLITRVGQNCLDLARCDKVVLDDQNSRDAFGGLTGKILLWGENRRATRDERSRVCQQWGR